MKNTNIRFRFFAWIILATGITACTHSPEYPEKQVLSPEGLPVTLSISRAADEASPLVYRLYVFSRPIGEGEYRLDHIIDPLTGASRLKFNNEQLIQKEYRFLFLAGPNDNSALKVTAADHNAPASGTSWTDIRIFPQADSISTENYFEVSDRSAGEILATDTIFGHLNRIVGQMTFRFFKIGENLDDLQPIDVKSVTSIFDRIQNIRIDYENYTPGLSFNAEGLPQPEPQSPGQPVISQKIIPQLQNFRLNLPQKNLVLLQGDPANGGEIRGYCFLPNNRQMRTTLTFTYYDTTPTCNNLQHRHETQCYPLKTLTLSIPQPSASGLSVEANAYTVSKAGIDCDRIIDIEYETNMDIQTDWLEN